MLLQQQKGQRLNRLLGLSPPRPVCSSRGKRQKSCYLFIELKVTRVAVTALRGAMGGDGTSTCNTQLGRQRQHRSEHSTVTHERLWWLIVHPYYVVQPSIAGGAFALSLLQLLLCLHTHLCDLDQACHRLHFGATKICIQVHQPLPADRPAWHSTAQQQHGSNRV